MINFISFFFKNYIKKVYLIYLSFALTLIFANLIFIKYWIIEHPYQIDMNGNLLINKIQFYFEEPLNNLLNNKSPSNIIANIEFKISKGSLIFSRRIAPAPN